MAVKVKKAVLWKRDLVNRPGTLAESLKPFAQAKQNLQVVMGYNYPGEKDRSALEVFPIAGSKGQAAARTAGLEPMAHTNCLLVEGDDRVGLAYAMADGLARSGVNISFAIIQVVGKKFLGIFGFDSSDSALRAEAVIKSAGNTGKAVKQKARSRSSRKIAGRSKTVKRGAGKPARKPAGKKRTAGKKSVAKK